MFRLLPIHRLRLVVLLLSSASLLLGDTVRSKAGDVLHGTLISETPDEIIFESTLAGRVTLARKDIASIMLDRSVEDLIEEEESGIPAYFREKLDSVAAPIFEPGDEEFDWIQLTSGEWLKGELRSVYRQSIEFESDELDSLTIDWDKVERMRTAGNYSVRINSNLTRSGPLTLYKEKITIGDGVPAEVNQYGLISIAPEASNRYTGWTAYISAATTLRGGLSTQRDLDINAILQRRTSKRKLYLDFLSSYSETEGLVTADSVRSNAYFDLLRSRKTFIRAASVEFFRDPVQNIEQRWTLGASYGYYFFDEPKRTWDVSVGPAFQRIEYIDVGPEGQKVIEEPAIVVASQFDWEITNRLDLFGNYSVQFTKGQEGATYHALTKLKYELTRYLDLDVSLVWDRINDQQRAPDDPEVENPSADDIRLTIGLGLDY